MMSLSFKVLHIVPADASRQISGEHTYLELNMQEEKVHSVFVLVVCSGAETCTN